MFPCEFLLFALNYGLIHFFFLLVFVSSAHPVGSSIMMLGGFGFLSRLHGLSIDNLVEVEMVLADGRIVVVSENEYPGKSPWLCPCTSTDGFKQIDLWWALRGAGPVFGIATRYKARAYPVPVVFAGNLI
jgi:FAD/FMN-containing dehydrogenase